MKRLLAFGVVGLMGLGFAALTATPATATESTKTCIQDRVVTASKMLFRASGTAVPANKDNGYFFGDLTLGSAAPISFTDYTAGSVDGQHGWSSTGAFDQEVIPKIDALRISNAVTSGSFGDQTFSPATATPASESLVNKHFASTFLFGTTQDEVQPGLSLSVSPDNGQGARSSYLRFVDKTDGVHVFFVDVQGMDPAAPTTANFVESDIATLTRTAPHKIGFSIDYVNGPANDVVKIKIDGVLKATGTTWEDYYRFDPEAKDTPLAEVCTKIVPTPTETTVPPTTVPPTTVPPTTVPPTTPAPSTTTIAPVAVPTTTPPVVPTGQVNVVPVGGVEAGDGSSLASTGFDFVPVTLGAGLLILLGAGGLLLRRRMR